MSSIQSRPHQSRRMINSKVRGERLALQRCSGASVVLAAFLIPLAYYRHYAAPNLGACGGAVPPDPSGVTSDHDAAARARFETVFAAYLRRHKAATALLDAPEPWADHKAASSLRLVVAPVCREVRRF